MNEIQVTGQETEVQSKANGNVIADMGRAYSLAKVMSNAEIIPDTYKNKPADCMIAIDMANRMGVSPLMVMQSLYVVKGKPSWSGQACMSFIQANPNFYDARHVYNEDNTACYVSAKRTSDGSEVKGVTVTIEMAKKEGWYSKTGSKWQTMPELMLAYRASAFFARVHCPSILMGCAVEGEVEDISNNEKRKVADVLE